MLRPVPTEKPTGGSDPAAPAAGAAAPGAATPLPRSAWWVRLLSHVPFAALYLLADILGWLAFRVFPHREEVVRTNLSLCFPELDEAGMRAIRRQYYAGFADVLVEVIKSATISSAEIRRRVRIVGMEGPQALLEQGRSVLLAAAHQCNWEWMLLALSLALGFPLDAAYKPLVDSWAEREMKKVRSRFGSRLIPAKELLADIIKRGKVVRAVAMVADQEPTTSEHKHWTRFLNRDTAFYMGPEEIARVTRFPVFFIGMRRTARGLYELSFTPLSSPGESLQTGELTERYVRLVEQQIRAAPADWPWSHKRWKLKKSLYAR
ncbi:MAG TPA: lysophospholipid acyltransferase family protein [Steroidobacteraceae bacterium]|jgi:KDO2-lipid IV(A) lauroyltransferase|nr:lysophospholipid acyltransferase family protein [Steroidobacteraceae bacterium]